MHYLGIDFGLSHVGFALSEEGILAQPLTQVNYHLQTDLLKKIIELVKVYDIQLIVFGLPDGEVKSTIQLFTKKLAEITNIPIVFEDETLSSHQAREILINSHAPLKKRRNKEHQVAAAVILQSYLDNLNDSLI